jgi:uncharacterized protein YvpB
MSSPVFHIHPIVARHYYPFKKSQPDHRDFKFEIPDEKIALPSSVDLSQKMPPVLDQGNLGSCVSNATSNCLRYLLKKESEKEFQPSRLYIYWNARVNIEKSPADEDTGVAVRDACKAIQKYHACDETIWPYDISKFNVAPPLTAYKNANIYGKFVYSSVNQNLTSLKQTLVKGYPIVFGIQVYDSLENQEVISTGEVPIPDTSSEQLLGGHCIALVGYDDSIGKFTFQNSWGTSCGLPQKRGYFHIPYAYVTNPDLACDFWVLSFFGTPAPTPVVHTSFKLESAIYGSHSDISKRVDVTSKISTILDSHGSVTKQIGDHPSSYDSFFGIDPAHGIVKVLWITYSRNGGSNKTVTFSENSHISLP